MDKMKGILLSLLLVGIVIVSGCVNNQVSTGNSAASEQQTQPKSETTNQQKVSICEPNWQCNSWSSCSPSGTQTRSCTDSKSCRTNTNKPIESQSCEYIVYSPEYIKSFKIEEGSGILMPYFALEDKNGTNTLGEGKANIQIKNADGKTVFTQELNFKPSDFIESATQNNLKIYRWNISTTNIQKGSSGIGTADLNLTMTDGKVLKDTYSGFSIPSYTSAELKQMWEDDYNKNAKISREVISKGNFEVTLVKYGFYTHRPDGVSSKERSDFRADIKVKNIGSELKCFSIRDAKMTSDSKEYEKSLYSNFPLYSFFPASSPCLETGFLNEGYIVYIGGYGENDVVPQNLTGQIKLNVGIDEYTEGASSYEFTVTL